MQTGLLPVRLLHVLLRLRLNELSPAVSLYAERQFLTLLLVLALGMKRSRELSNQRKLGL